jgi:hypothetical protein
MLTAPCQLDKYDSDSSLCGSSCTYLTHDDVVIVAEWIV